VDVELYDIAKNKPVDFGSPRDLDDGISFLHSDKINTQQKQNRTLLLTTMLGAGFASVYCEWWHFSYGDNVWAWFYKHKDSLYDKVGLDSDKSTSL
jgi:D-alanyl-D-alanine dipeptidase